MEIGSLNVLKLKNGVYEFYIKTKRRQDAIPIYVFECTERHDMRLDLVCFDIYESTDFLDVLCKLNGILNPLTVQNQDIIFYTDEDTIQNMQDDTELLDGIRESISNANIGKQRKMDPARMNDITKRRKVEQDKKFIPPNILDATENIEIIEDGPDFSPKDGVVSVPKRIILKPSF
jgi:hypothetical protein